MGSLFSCQTSNYNNIKNDLSNSLVRNSTETLVYSASVRKKDELNESEVVDAENHVVKLYIKKKFYRKSFIVFSKPLTVENLSATHTTPQAFGMHKKTYSDMSNLANILKKTYNDKMRISFLINNRFVVTDIEHLEKEVMVMPCVSVLSDQIVSISFFN
jgi:hypothetical protein